MKDLLAGGGNLRKVRLCPKAKGSVLLLLLRSSEQH